MDPLTKTQALDRHALAMAIWLAFGFVAVVLTLFVAALAPSGNDT